MSTPRNPLAVYPGMTASERAEVRERRRVHNEELLERIRDRQANLTDEERADRDRLNADPRLPHRLGAP